MSEIHLSRGGRRNEDPFFPFPLNALFVKYIRSAAEVYYSNLNDDDDDDDDAHYSKWKKRRRETFLYVMHPPPEGPVWVYKV